MPNQRTLHTSPNAGWRHACWHGGVFLPDARWGVCLMLGRVIVRVIFGEVSNNSALPKTVIQHFHLGAKTLTS